MSKAWETKKRILTSLKTKSKTLTDLSEDLGLSTSTVGQHIQELLQMNAITGNDDAQRKWKYYKINPAFNIDDYKRPGIMENRRALAAILVIGVVLLAALVAYILMPKGVAVSCVGGNGYTCTNPSVGGNGELSLGIGGLPHQANINGIACTYNNTTPGNFLSRPHVSINSSGYALLNASCASLGAPKANSTYHIWLKYSLNGNIIIMEIAKLRISQPAASTTIANVSYNRSSSNTTILPTTTVVRNYSNGTTSTVVKNLTTTVPRNSTNSTTTILPSTGCNTSLRLYVGGSAVCSQFKVVFLGLVQPVSNSTLNNTGGSLSGVFNIISINIYNTTFSTNVVINVGQTLITSFIAKSERYSLTLHLNSTYAGLNSTQKWAQFVMTASNSTVNTTTTTTILSNTITTNNTVNTTTTTTIPPTTTTTIPSNQTAALFIYAYVVSSPESWVAVFPGSDIYQLNTGQSAVFGKYKVTLANTYTSSNGSVLAAYYIYYNGSYIQTLESYPMNVYSYNESGNKLYIYTNRTSNGYAKIGLFSGVGEVSVPSSTTWQNYVIDYNRFFYANSTYYLQVLVSENGTIVADKSVTAGQVMAG